jgi:hypothetical protein
MQRLATCACRWIAAVAPAVPPFGLPLGCAIRGNGLLILEPDNWCELSTTPLSIHYVSVNDVLSWL